MTADPTSKAKAKGKPELPDVVDPNLPHGGIDLVDDTTDPVDDSPAESAPFDPMAELTLAELDDGSRLLKASIVSAVTERNQHYERALPVVAYLYARRTDRQVRLQDFTGMTWEQLHQAIAEMAPGVEAVDSPTQPRPE